MDLSSSTVVRSLCPPRRRGFPADLALGFYLHAPERMTYLGADKRPDPLGWILHRFVAFDGRLIRASLPPKARLFLWPVGEGPRPIDSVACRRSVFGRMPTSGLAALPPADLRRLYELWHRFNFATATIYVETKTPRRSNS